MSAESAIWCSPKGKIIPIRLCNRCGPDRRLSLRATSWYFAAALHGFVRVDDRMMWQVPLKFVSGFVKFKLLDFADITSSDVSVIGLLCNI